MCSLQVSKSLRNPSDVENFITESLERTVLLFHFNILECSCKAKYMDAFLLLPLSYCRAPGLRLFLAISWFSLHWPSFYHSSQFLLPRNLTHGWVFVFQAQNPIEFRFLGDFHRYLSLSLAWMKLLRVYSEFSQRTWSKSQCSTWTWVRIIKSYF